MPVGDYTIAFAYYTCFKPFYVKKDVQFHVINFFHEYSGNSTIWKQQLSNFPKNIVETRPTNSVCEHLKLYFPDTRCLGKSSNQNLPKIKVKAVGRLSVLVQCSTTLKKLYCTYNFPYCNCRKILQCFTSNSVKYCSKYCRKMTQNSPLFFVFFQFLKLKSWKYTANFRSSLQNVAFGDEKRCTWVTIAFLVCRSSKFC